MIFESHAKCRIVAGVSSSPVSRMPAATPSRSFSQPIVMTWAATISDRLRPVLGDRYVVYGEWLYAKHTIFYDRLPHYFLEFDVLDRRTHMFLDTPARRDLLAGLPIASVPVLRSGRITDERELTSLVGPSLCRTAR